MSAATPSRRPTRPFMLGGAVGLIVGVVVGSLVASLASRTIAALRSLRRRVAPDAEPPFEFLAQ